MTALILLCTAITTAWTVEWCQRRRENWCQVRDKDLSRTTCDVHYPRPVVRVSPVARRPSHRRERS
jgi:hypothetical protein